MGNILVKRLKEEEEYERLIMYARNVRFEGDVGRPKWEHARIIVCMLHCLMRMHEKVLFLLYFAAMKRCAGDAETTNETLDRMTGKIVISLRAGPINSTQINMEIKSSYP
jgi:hypothetical protein